MGRAWHGAGRGYVCPVRNRVTHNLSLDTRSVCESGSGDNPTHTCASIGPSATRSETFLAAHDLQPLHWRERRSGHSPFGPVSLQGPFPPPRSGRQHASQKSRERERERGVLSHAREHPRRAPFPRQPGLTKGRQPSLRGPQHQNFPRRRLENKPFAARGLTLPDATLNTHVHIRPRVHHRAIPPPLAHDPHILHPPAL